MPLHQGVFPRGEGVRLQGGRLQLCAIHAAIAPAADVAPARFLPLPEQVRQTEAPACRPGNCITIQLSHMW